MLTRVLLASLLAAGCGSGSPDSQADASMASPDASPALPAKVTILITSATIAPFKADRTEWDSASTVSGDLAKELISALDGTDPFDAVISYLGSTAVTTEVSGYDKPDPEGNAYLWANGAWGDGIPLAAIQDTFTPSWNDGWQHVSLTPSLRVEVVLDDQDLVNNDPIGSVQLSYSDLVSALQAGKIYQVNVATQGQNQLLFVGISVTGE
jgi:hypothetical protein